MFFARSCIRFPPDLAMSLEKALSTSTVACPQKLGGALRSLWPKLAKERGRAADGKQHYSFRQEEVEAYAAYYLPANCLKPALVLEESWLCGIDPVPKEARWLDLGTGPGTAFWGAAWWCAHRGKKLRFTGWDQSPRFTGIARNLAAASPFPASADFLTGEDPLTLVRRLRPTHVSFMNSLAEIYPDEKLRSAECGKILQALRELERDDGHPRFLLLIDPGSRESSRELAALKDSLQAEKRGEAVLPCLDDRPCGALVSPQDWCHEEVACEFPPWVNELGSQAGLRKEAVLFSYAWLRVEEGGSLPAKGAQRIVSQRMERKGQVECRLCTARGKVPVRVQRSRSRTETEFFLSCGRGDIWSNAEIGPKGDLLSAVPAAFLASSSLFGN